jgi:hypothetical protein
MENLYTPNCIRTFSGQYVNVFNPDPETINIEDIAHALSFQCRFGGHMPEFYSVAQHLINCSYMADDEHRYAALMHDASEAYLLDIPRPIKKGLANYTEIEDNLMRAIATRFNFTYPMSPHVKYIDDQMLNIEWDTLILKKKRIEFMHPFSSSLAKKSFLERFHELGIENIVTN